MDRIITPLTVFGLTDQPTEPPPDMRLLWLMLAATGIVTAYLIYKQEI